jgi:methylase of polypeptide subunit release factors
LITGKNDLTFLDIGCGSGVLSYIFAKQFKKSRVYCLDKNPDAVKTTNLNAARLEYHNVEAF